MRKRYAGASAIVTGGGSGIGAALTRALVSAGSHVVCSDIDLPAATRVAGSVTGPGSARLDVTDSAAERNRGLLVTPRSARIAWRFGRIASGLVQKASARFVDQRRASFKTVEAS